MTADLDYQTAAQAIHLRIQLMRSGAFRVCKVDGHPGVLAVLPGSGSIARMHVVPARMHAARLCYPTGRGLSMLLDIRDPMRFASFMHNVDAEIHRGKPGGLPYEVARFADAVLLTDDPEVRREANMLFGEGRALDMGDPPEPWRLPYACTSLVEAALASKDDVLGFAVEALRAVSVGEAPGTPFDDLTSLIRWSEQTDVILRRVHGRADEVLEAGDCAWLRLITPVAVMAEARALGYVEGQLLGPIGSARDLLRPERMRVPDPVGARFIDDGRQFWSLRDAGGRRLAVATLGKDGVLTVRGPEGLDDAISPDVVETLRSHLGMDGPAVRPYA